MRDRIGDLQVGWHKRGHTLGFGVGISLGYATLGLESGSVDAAALERTIAADIAKWTALARKSNIKAD